MTSSSIGLRQSLTWTRSGCAWALVRSVDDVLWGLEIYGSDVDWDLECARVVARSF